MMHAEEQQEAFVRALRSFEQMRQSGAQGRTSPPDAAGKKGTTGKGATGKGATGKKGVRGGDSPSDGVRGGGVSPSEEEKRGIYVYGSPGCGKSTFVRRALEAAGYDMVYYDASDVRNKSVIETMGKGSMANRNVMSMFRGCPKPIAVVMDEIDGMTSGDKGGINALIKLVKVSKTGGEALANMPIVCIGKDRTDKKISELMAACHVIHLPTPSDEYIRAQLGDTADEETVDRIRGNLHRLDAYLRTHTLPAAAAAAAAPPSAPNKRKSRGSSTRLLKRAATSPPVATEDGEGREGQGSDVHSVTQRLFARPHPISAHRAAMSDTDRTTVALMWHENVVDRLRDEPDAARAVGFYVQTLRTMCFADYIDRVRFQHQIWQFSEMSSLLKTFGNNKRLHDAYPGACAAAAQTPLRFTKVLTKYSTEYGNTIFVTDLCVRLGLDRKDMFALFARMQSAHGKDLARVVAELEDVVDKNAVNRIFKYLSKFAPPYTISSASGSATIARWAGGSA